MLNAMDLRMDLLRVHSILYRNNTEPPDLSATISTMGFGNSVAFCSHAKSLTFSGLMENPVVGKKLKS